MKLGVILMSLFDCVMMVTDKHLSLSWRSNGIVAMARAWMGALSLRLLNILAFVFFVCTAKISSLTQSYLVFWFICCCYEQVIEEIWRALGVEQLDAGVSLKNVRYVMSFIMKRDVQSGMHVVLTCS